MISLATALHDSNSVSYRHFAAIAALAMLISVVYDPFIQNLVSYTVQQVNDQQLGLEPSALLSYAITYDVLKAGGSKGKWCH